MENTVWEDDEVMKMLAEKYVVVGLYTDDRTKLPEEEWFTSNVDGEVKDNLGRKEFGFTDLKIQNQ